MTSKPPAQEALDDFNEGMAILRHDPEVILDAYIDEETIRRALKILEAIESGELVDVLNYQDFYSGLELLKAIERAKGNNDILAKLKEIGEEK